MHTFDATMQDALPSAARTRLHVVLRVLVAVLGGYGSSAALVALLPLPLAVLGVARSDAVVVSAMLGYLVFLVLGLWAFVARSLRRPAIVLGAGLLAWLALLAGAG